MGPAKDQEAQKRKVARAFAIKREARGTCGPRRRPKPSLCDELLRAHD